ncbi:glycosyl hydrolase [Paenibacillus sp. 1P07SE]|uniref:glycosyl hydrolase n=1 Tax=Paenibacillus sp. 1P07SE TaxID=3132209 RepID=UPI0039A5BEB2
MKLTTTQQTDETLNDELLRDPPAAYRSLPFWSWNDKLEAGELRRQIQEMKAAGLGGFFMHARAGLLTDYMGGEWMRMIEASIEEAQAQGLEAWYYDENGWPSGAANGEVPAAAAAYRQQWLEAVPCPDAGAEPEQAADPSALLATYTGAQGQTIAIVVKSSPHYTDLLNEAAVRCFIQVCHERYEQRFGAYSGNAVRGVFTDEPQLARQGWPWSVRIAELYESWYGSSILPVLHLLFEPASDPEAARAVRYRYWKIVSHQFAAGSRIIGEWCEAHGWGFTGHVMGENNLMSQMQCTGGAMPYYEHMSMPGIDLLGRTLELVNIPKQASSVARQLGMREVLTETFGCCGWDLSLEEMKRIAEWQFVLGINRLCPHLQSYSLKGVRKRDYPPSLFDQQPWWKTYRQFNDYFARLTYMLTLGEAVTDTLVLHPIRSAWLIHDRSGSSAEELAQLSARWLEVSQALLAQQIDYDYGDEGLMHKHGAVEQGKLRIGRQTYKTVILPGLLGLDRHTLSLLNAFAEQGGKVLVVGECPTCIDGAPGGDNDFAILRKHAGFVAAEHLGSLSASIRPTLRVRAASRVTQDLSKLYVQKRRIGGAMLYYCVNTSDRQTLELMLSLRAEAGDHAALSLIELESGRMLPLGWDALERVVFRPGQSYLFLARDKGDAGRQPVPSSAALRLPDRIRPEGGAEAAAFQEAWQLRLHEPNALTLDYARYRIDGGAWSEQPVYVLNIQEACIACKQPVEVELEFTFHVEETAGLHTGGIQLAMEDRTGWLAELNGQPVPLEASGSCRDHAIGTYAVGAFVRPGENRLLLKRDFHCSEDVYAYHENTSVHEIVRNKLTYDVEIESVYLLGDFGVQPGDYVFDASAEPGVWRAGGGWRLTAPPVQAFLHDMTPAGLWFYAGEASLSQTIAIGPEEQQRLQAGERFVLTWEESRIPAAAITVNGGAATAVLWAPYVCDITEQLEPGDNEIRVTLMTSCRNWLGPHHHVSGELHFVGPSSFTDRLGWVDRGLKEKWTDSYSFVACGLTGFAGKWTPS